ncbi:hypothetical protein GCM10011371_34900 [Novosphingobium marinum]|uniref:Lipocalin-like domain-containing protein n=1 Tax=Novosphingobium marinum TaxID=1514948 RepID=A0A7Y9XZE0_9SPHN|nr:hypothetical protein [Novosphingobium marinum]NYH97195.1 hypothetical protein [Novosphingobium marinum]GGC44499.1 hypothetical protein GCM10011371_34900 [Novosphingobium marinum]
MRSLAASAICLVLAGCEAPPADASTNDGTSKAGVVEGPDGRWRLTEYVGAPGVSSGADANIARASIGQTLEIRGDILINPQGEECTITHKGSHTLEEFEGGSFGGSWSEIGIESGTPGPNGVTYDTYLIEAYCPRGGYTPARFVQEHDWTDANAARRLLKKSVFLFANDGSLPLYRVSGHWVRLEKVAEMNDRMAPSGAVMRPDNGPWKAYPGDRRANIKVAYQDGPSLSGGCNARLGGDSYGFSLYDYGGSALRRVDDEGEPIIFEIVSAEGEVRRFESMMHYFAPDEAWVITQGHNVPSSFADKIGAGEVLRLVNGNGEEVIAFSTDGASSAFETSRRVCQS